jgi:1-acyl-sn-glycerol-3-phosphate acyltransferase
LTGGLAIQNRPDTAIFGGAALPMGGFLGKIFSGGGGRQGQGLEFLAAKKGQGLSGIELIKAFRVLNEERAVSLAAEGEISWDGKLQSPLAPGAAWMALRAHAPVVAIISSGGYDVMPRWSRFPSLTGRVTIRIGKPFYVHNEPITRLTEELISDASDKIYQEMASLIVE